MVCAAFTINGWTRLTALIGFQQVAPNYRCNPPDYARQWPGFQRRLNVTGLDCLD
jgi:hypothetical protein